MKTVVGAISRAKVAWLTKCWSGVLLCSMLSFSLWATPIHLNETLNELDVQVESSLVGLRASAFIENLESEAISCTVIFRNGPELPVQRRERVNPGVKKMVVANMKRGIVKLVIDVTCEPAR